MQGINAHSLANYVVHLHRLIEPDLAPPTRTA